MFFHDEHCIPLYNRIFFRLVVKVAAQLVSNTALMGSFITLTHRSVVHVGCVVSGGGDHNIRGQLRREEGRASPDPLRSDCQRHITGYPITSAAASPPTHLDIEH